MMLLVNVQMEGKRVNYLSEAHLCRRRPSEAPNGDRRDEVVGVGYGAMIVEVGGIDRGCKG